MTNLTATLQQLRKSSPAKEDHVNRAGAPSYQRSLKEQVLAVLTTGNLNGTFYASREELASEAVEVLVRARDADSSFLARALVYARSVGLMKTLPVLGLVILSGGGGRSKKAFECAFPHVITTPDDLRSFVEICKSGVIRGRKGLGGMTVEPVREYLRGMSEYHSLKYGSAVSEQVTLRDILRMAHPRPGTPECAERFAWLCKGRVGLGSDTELNPQLRSLEALKLSATEDAQVTLIREGRLPFEVVVPSLKGTTVKIWSELLRQAPYMNLLRNLSTFTRHGVFADEASVRFAVGKLTNPRAIEHSKVLPFRFFNAWTAYMASEGFDVRIADALRSALELSFANMPSFGNRTVVIAPDVSGSMNKRVSDKGTARCVDIAGLFTGALLKRCEDRALVLPFDTGIHADHSLSKRDDILVTAKKVAGYVGGGTAVGAPVQYLLNRKIRADVVIGITDDEDWACGRDGNYASDKFYSLWLRYRKEVNPEAVAFLVTVAPYRDAVAPTGAKGVHFIYGWSDRVLRHITTTLEAGESQVENVERMDLGALPSGRQPSDASDAQTEE